MEKNNFEIMKDLGGYFKEKEREAVYYAVDNPRDKVLIRMLWVTGRRISEILNIKVSDIDFEAKNVLINVLKKGRPYQNFSHLDNISLHLLSKYITYRNLIQNDYLFKSDFIPSRPITRQRAFKIILNACNKAGIFQVGSKRPHPHHFRHSFAVDVARNLKTPADVRMLQQTMDHSSLAVTEKYLKFNQTELSKILDNLYEAKKD